MRSGYFFILIIIILSFRPESISAQESVYKKTAVSFNITRLLINEYNFGFERFTSNRKSIEFEFGIIYPNEMLQDATSSFTTDPLFYESGFAVRSHLKTWRKVENSKWRNYSAPGISYKHLYYNDYAITEDGKTDGLHKPYTETLLQDRVRDKYGFDFIWGNVYEASSTFAFEIYYGAGLTLTSVERTDHDRYITYDNPTDQARNQSLPTYIDYSVYLRPVVQLGFKLVVRL